MTETKILHASIENILDCVEYLKNGDVVGIPTETVYGLAADAFNADAVAKIFKIKGRPSDNPLICHISDLKMLDYLTCGQDSSLFRNITQKFWPGPLTVILPKKASVLDLVSANLETVAIRFPSNAIARSLIGSFGRPLVAPSANLSGRPSPTTALHVYNDLKGRIGAILDGGECEIGLESTVIRIEGDLVEVLRPGAVSVDMLKSVAANVSLSDSVLKPNSSNCAAVSPGMKYAHYSPKAEIVLIDSSFSSFCKYVLDRTGRDVWCVVFDGEQGCFQKNVLTFGSSPASQARNVFSILRKLDEVGARKAFFRAPSKSGIGLAIYNRLLRASGFNLVVL